jgi:hypothetical protein
VAADVRELVREEGFDRFRRKTRGGAERKENDGPDRSERRRHGERRRLHQADRTGHAEPFAEPRERREQVVGRGGDLAANETARRGPAREEPQRKEKDAEQPAGDEEGLERSGAPANSQGEASGGGVFRGGRFGGDAGCLRRAGRRGRGFDGGHGWRVAGLRAVRQEGRDRHRQHQEKRAAADGVAKGGLAASQRQPGASQESRDDRALPEKGEESPADPLEQRTT